MFKSFSGPVIVGDHEIPAPTTSQSIARQWWLTTRVETGATYGTVVMYDGTAVTAGPDQFIMVYPRELEHEDFNAADDQGLLGKLLARLFAVDSEAMLPKKAALSNAFAARGWYLSPVGLLHYSCPQEVVVGGRKIKVRKGDLVHGAVIRDVVTPVGGQVPKRGMNWQASAAWCQLFHEVFNEPTGFSVQNAFGIERLVKAYQRPRLRINGTPHSVQKVLFGDIDVASLRCHEIGEDLDLALAVWYSNSVNAPAIAIRCLQAVLPAGMDFPSKLIRELGTSRYGRWNADDPNGRYQRTRRLAMLSGLWPKQLFEGDDAVMPRSLSQERTGGNVA